MSAFRSKSHTPSSSSPPPSSRVVTITREQLAYYRACERVLSRADLALHGPGALQTRIANLSRAVAIANRTAEACNPVRRLTVSIERKD